MCEQEMRSKLAAMLREGLGPRKVLGLSRALASPLKTV